MEFLKFWEQLPNKGFFFILLIAWLALFQFLGNSTFGYIPTHSLMQWMYVAYHPNKDTYTEDSHGLMIPFVVLALFWWKRNELVATKLETWWPALAFVTTGLVLHLLGYMVQQPKISIIGLFSGLYGITGLAWGPGWLKRSFFPFVLLAFCVPLGTLGQPVTFPLRLMVSQIVESISHLISIDVIREGNVLKDPTGRYQYEVAAACSGLRSLIATIALAMIYGVLSFKTWWKRALLTASAIPLAIAGNVLRMLTIVIAAEMGGQTSGNYVHEGGPFGIISLMPYIPAFIGLLALGHWLREQPITAEPSLAPQTA